MNTYLFLCGYHDLKKMNYPSTVFLGYVGKKSLIGMFWQGVPWFLFSGEYPAEIRFFFPPGGRCVYSVSESKKEFIK